MLATLSEHEQRLRLDNDQINREIFEEQVELVLEAWQNDSIEAKGGRWQIPYPYEEGIDWRMTATRDMGAPGEMDAAGRIRRISVVPSLYRPVGEIPIFVSSNASKETVEYCGRKGFIPTYFSGSTRMEEYAQAYVETAAENGRQVALGQNQAAVRWIHIADTEEKAHEDVLRYDADIFRDLYAGLSGLPFDPAKALESILNSGIYIAGTPTQVRDKFVETWSKIPTEYVVLIWHFAQMPKERVIENMSQFMEHVKPELDACTAPYDSGT
jgi:alkanesulfonate monooxygenase SsuD/methylene tetrahydromethanopterin reductase-like flavin-dependent oxidoreductase (luciferase family)